MSQSDQAARSDAVAGQNKPAQGRRSGIGRWLLWGCGAAALLACVAVAAFLIWMQRLSFNPKPLWTYANPAGQAENRSRYRLIGVRGEQLIVQIHRYPDYHAFMALDRRSGAELWRTSPITSGQDQDLEIGDVTSELLTDRRLIASTYRLWPDQRRFLLAIDLAGGRLLWQQPGFLAPSDGYLAGGGELLFVTEAETGHLVGLDGETGAVRVRTEIPAQHSLVADGIVYGQGPEGGLFAVDGGESAGAALLWQIETGELADALSFAEGRLFYRTRDDGRLTALDATTGRELWAWPDVWWYTAAGDNLAVIENDGNEGADLVVLAAATGDLRQRLPLFVGAQDNNAHPVVSDGVLYQATGKRLAALDLRGGRPPWESDLPFEVDWMDSGNGVIVVGDAFYATFYETHPTSPGSPFSSSHWYIAVGDMRTGKIRQWGAVVWDQIITDGEFLYGSNYNNGTVRAIKP